MSEAYKPRAEWFATQGEKYMGRSYKEMDCQGLVERMLQDVGIHKDWKGSNHMWRTALSWRGTPEECIAEFGEIPVGAWLFVLKQDGGEVARGYNDGDGNASHVGVYTGTGLGAINSSSTKGQVCESKFEGKAIRGGWNRVGLCKYLDYGTEEKEMARMYVSLGFGTQGTVNMRKGPAKTEKIIEAIPTGTIVQAEPMGDWAVVKAPSGRTGYMMTEYLSTVNPQVSAEDPERHLIPLTEDISLSLTKAAGKRILEQLQLLLQ